MILDTELGGGFGQLLNVASLAAGFERNAGRIARQAADVAG